MSRFLIACSLVAALTTTAFANSASAPRFARPPQADVYEPANITAPERVLDRATVRAKLVEARAANVARFRAYQQRGVFPSNTHKPGKLNVWIDEAGNLCAAATIINDSGLTELVLRVAEQNNFIRLRDVRQGPLMDWMLTSGLTQDEIVAIQEPGFNVRQNEPPMPRIAEPAQPSPVLVDADLRKAENLRMTARYKQVDAMIVKNQKQSLDLAVDRLMKNPTLAWTLIDG